AMQQDHGRAGPVRCVPDPSIVVFDVALTLCNRQRRGAVRFKPAEVVVVLFHFDLLGWLCRYCSLSLRWNVLATRGVVDHTATCPKSHRSLSSVPADGLLSENRAVRVSWRKPGCGDQC